MGKIYEASCNCGFNKEFGIGGGRLDFQYNCPFPFYCRKCGLVSVNVYRSEFKCPKCRTRKIVPYGCEHQYLYNEFFKSDNVVDFESVKLTDKLHICPSCKKMTLKMSLIGFSD